MLLPKNVLIKVTSLVLLLITYNSLVIAQTVGKKSTVSNTKKSEKAEKENNPASDGDFSGVSVSPSSFHFAVKPGAIETKDLKITNDTKKTFKFKIGYSDFVMGRTGKAEGLQSVDSKYALSRWLSVPATFIEVKPGESQKIPLTIKVPSDETGNTAAWTVITIDQEKEKQPLSPDNTNDKQMNIGVAPSFGFGVYVYQNPPNVIINHVEIQTLKYRDSTGGKCVSMVVKNVGDGIGYCTSYLELTSLSTGKKIKLGVKRFTILPQFYRDFVYSLPNDLQKGNYSALGVIDYGNEEDIKVAELNIKIQ